MKTQHGDVPAAHSKNGFVGYYYWNDNRHGMSPERTLLLLLASLIAINLCTHIRTVAWRAPVAADCRAETSEDNGTKTPLTYRKRTCAGDVHQGVDECAGNQRARFHPRVAVEQSCDSGQKHVLPVREWRVEDVRQAENHRRHYDQRHAHSFFSVFESRFCKSPRNRNSSGHAVKNKIPSAVRGNERRRESDGLNTRNPIRMPT